MIRLIKILAGLFILAIISISIIVFYFSRDLPDYSQLANYYPPSVTRIYAADGKLMEEYAYEHRVFVPISSIPRSLIEAFIAAEDKNFYSHPGVDIVSILRALIANITNKLHNKGKLEGGSTITQQVVKNFLLTPEKSYKRKIKEAVLSYMISRVLTKDQILELYLNQLYLGKGHGVAIAAQNYFNKSIDELTLAESAFLAALPKAPSNYNPKTNYEKSKERRDYVINRMLEDGYITEASAREAIDTPIVIRTRNAAEVISADYYAETVRDLVIKMLGKETFYTGGLTIITCLDPKLQRDAENSLADGLRNYDQTRGYKGPVTQISTDNWQQNFKQVAVPGGLKNYKLALVLEISENTTQLGFMDGTTGKMSSEGTKWAGSAKKLFKKGDVIIVEPNKTGYTLRQIPKVNGGIVVMEPNTGKVLAAQGGYDFKASKFDRVTQALRQPGSLSKTFVYLAALEDGIEPNEIFDDGPISVYLGPGLPYWTPKNYSGSFLGPLTLRQGLEKSRNLVTVRVAQSVGVNKVAEIMKRFAINDEPAKRYSMVLGALETTLLRMTNAYTILASDGAKVEPQFIEVIKDRNGKIIYQRDKRVCDGCFVSDESLNNGVSPKVTSLEKKMITDEASNYQIVSILTGVVQRGTAVRAKKLGGIIAGKTGTTNDSKDTWFIGFTPNIVVGTYVGYDTPKDLGSRSTGSTIALPIFINFMEQAFPKLPALPFKVPDSVKLVNYGGLVEAFKKDSPDDNQEHRSKGGYKKEATYDDYEEDDFDDE